MSSYLSQRSDAKEMESKKSFKCHSCEQTFKSRQGRHSHVRVIHKGIRYPCHLCSKTFSTTFALKEHLKIHNGQLDHKCNICNKSFARSGTLTSHKIIHLGDSDKQHECFLCRRVFLRKADRDKHIVTHTLEKPHKCRTCGKCFGHNHYLKKHQMTHSGDNPNSFSYACSRCPRKYTSSFGLWKHSKEHQPSIGLPGFDCIFCNKTLQSYAGYEIHLRTHVGEMRTFCELCDRGFATKRNKDLHIRRHHTLEKPYACEICGLRFTLNADLSRHSFTHLPANQPKRHSCVFCGTDFHFTKLLFRHIKSHIKEKAHSCKECCHESARSDKMRSHIKKMHKS